jgi:tetratricopeptide (TPR) repeat protein
MDFKKVLDEGKFLDIASAADSAANNQERLILGIALFKLGRDNEALKIFDEIAKDVEHLVKSHYYMALIYSQQGDMDSAQQCLKKYTSFYPDDDEAYDILEAPGEKNTLMSEPSLDLAKIYAQQGHYEEALDIYARVLKKPEKEPELKKDALHVQDMYILKTLETWLERIKK